MKGEYRIGVVIPARNEERFIQKVVETLPTFVDLAVVINDGSTDETQSILEAMESSEKVDIIKLDGEGVGAAIDAGHQYLLQHWPDQLFISVVMAGDGQMNPDDMEALLRPVIGNAADHAKGDRFAHPNGIEFHAEHTSTSKPDSIFLHWACFGTNDTRPPMWLYGNSQ